MTYKLPYQPTAETLTKIKAMLSLIVDIRRPMMGGDINKRFVELMDVTMCIAFRIKTICLRAGFLSQDYVPFTGNSYVYTLTDKALKFLDLAEKRNALVAWRKVMNDVL